jgi:hypothetical protein
MAQLTGAATSCCAPEQQAVCCEPSAKHDCCTPGGSSCGCREPEQDPPEQAQKRRAVRGDIR